MDERKRQSSASLAFVQGIHWWPVNSPHKWPVTRKMFPFDDVIMAVMFNISKIRPKSLPGPAKAQTFSLCLWRWPNMEIYSQNDCFGLVYDISSVHQKNFSNHQTIHVKKKHQTFDFNLIIHEHFFWMIRQYVWWFWTNHQTFCNIISNVWWVSGFQCLKLMATQSPLVTKNWAGPVKFDHGQVKSIIDYIKREIFWTFLGD